jgi:isoleucyl-tRNA synthetase
MATQQEIEEQMLKFWESKEIYKKSVKKNSKGEKFYFMDGPPYATGYIHLGTALNKTLKDVIMRSRRLMGYDVFDRPGYDTHGVPIEKGVEKELGLQNKQDIEKLGVDKFVEKCREFSTKYIGVMNNEFKNMGVWMDWDNPYIAYKDEYMEAIWSAFKEADKKGLLYLGKYPVHVCTTCATAVAFNEIEYEKQKDTAIYVKFPVKGKDKTFLLIWTTTPWTLPANTGVMVHPDVQYSEIETSEGERWIIAKDRLAAVMTKMERGFTLKKDWTGKELVGWEYENPLLRNMKIAAKNSYRVVPSARYVTTEDGTGMVHCAPGHGKEDYEVGRANKLEVLSPVDMNGNLTEETGKYAGKKARVVDFEIITDLKEMGMLAFKESYTHDYPMCWRDKTPLIMISMPQWFLKISKIQKELLKGNEKIDWNPDWVKLRMKAWLEGIGDWPVSRQRYWGTPLPIWYNENTGEKIVVGSLDELRKLSKVKKFDMHKPGIDAIEIKGKKGMLRRVPEVLDVWFDSGVSSWAALGYPKDKVKIKKYWPADVNIEGKDQIRGWWNSQFILSQILFGKLPMKQIFMHGMILDLGKKKMSKSLGNVISPADIIKKYGRDYLRYSLTRNAKGEDTAFDEKDFQEIHKTVNILNNLSTLILQLKPTKGKRSIEDKWILSKYNKLVEEVDKAYHKCDFMGVCQRLEDFTVREFSRRYVQMIRERSDDARKTLIEIYIGLLLMFAPVIPLTTENIWQKMKENSVVKEESIHLAQFPKSSKKDRNEKLEKEMELMFRAIENGLSERDKIKIGLKWPLASATISLEGKISAEMKEVIMQQLNVKKVNLEKGTLRVVFDTTQTKELEAEGYARELARKIQAERKNAGMTKEQKIRIFIFCDKNTNEMLMMNKEFLQERVNATHIEISDAVSPEGALDCSIKNSKIHVKFS